MLLDTGKPVLLLLQVQVLQEFPQLPHGLVAQVFISYEMQIFPVFDPVLNYFEPMNALAGYKPLELFSVICASVGHAGVTLCVFEVPQGHQRIVRVSNEDDRPAFQGSSEPLHTSYSLVDLLYEGRAIPGGQTAWQVELKQIIDLQTDPKKFKEISGPKKLGVFFALVPW